MYIYFCLMNHKPVNEIFKKMSLKFEIMLDHVVLYSGIYLNTQRSVNTRIQRGVRVFYISAEMF